MKRDKMLALRLTETEYAGLKTTADRLGISVSAYVRRCLAWPPSFPLTPSTFTYTATANVTEVRWLNSD